LGLSGVGSTASSAVPPCAVTRRIPPSGLRKSEKRISPWLPHVPVNVVAATAQITLGGPPAASNALSCPSAKNATERVSGDQNGEFPFSVPVNTRDEAEFRSRIQI